MNITSTRSPLSPAERRELDLHCANYFCPVDELFAPVRVGPSRISATRGAIPTMRNTPVLQNSITPLARIRGRGRVRSASPFAYTPEGVVNRRALTEYSPASR